LSDAGIGQLKDYTKTKAERAGLRVVKVAAHGTTQACARCGTKSPTKITLRDRIFSCACGWCADRDVNAALHILRKGLCPKPLLPEWAHQKKALAKAKNTAGNTSRRNAKKMGKKTSLRKDGGVVVPGVGYNQSDSSDRRRNLVELNNSN